MSITNAPGDDVYPISSFTWMLLEKVPKDKVQSKVMVDFMKWALTDGQKFAPDLGYAPIPKNVVDMELKALTPDQGSVARPRRFLDTLLKARPDEIIFRGGTGLFAVALIAVVVGIAAGCSGNRGSRFKHFGWQFWQTDIWNPVAGEFGARPFIWGTLYSSVLALLIAGPIALGIAIYVSELAPARQQRPLVFLTELLAAIPSIVYGLWGIFILVPFVRRSSSPRPRGSSAVPLFQGPPLGLGMLSAAIVLAIMVIPFMSSVAREVLRAVPQSQREAAYALGATRWEAIRMALFYARTGIIGAVMLGFGRALGETMAVTMVIGNTPQISLSLYAPQYSMAAVLANEFAEAADRSVLACARRDRARAVHHDADHQRHFPQLHLVARETGATRARPTPVPQPRRSPDARPLAPLPVARDRGPLLAAVLLALVPLAFVLFYVVTQGITSLNVAFFTHMPTPVGEPGGGMVNSILGSLLVTGLGALVAIPVGLTAGIYAAEFKGTRLAAATRFAADTLNGVPSIVIGVFAYVIGCCPSISSRRLPARSRSRS